MNRLTSFEQGYWIGQAMGIIPERVMDRLRHVEFLTGVDPTFVGLHDFRVTPDGRSYSRTAHTAYRHQTHDRSTTIVLPAVRDTYSVLHELGHALHEVVGWNYLAKPVTDYARMSPYEAFAESFCSWLLWYGDQDVFYSDDTMLTLFESLR